MLLNSFVTKTKSLINHVNLMKTPVHNYTCSTLHCGGKSKRHPPGGDLVNLRPLVVRERHRTVV